MEGLVSTTWWPSLTMHSHSMPYCRQYPGIYHCDWGEGAQLGPKGSVTGGSTEHVTAGVYPAKSICHMCVQWCKRVGKREREGGQMGSEGREGQRNRGGKEGERNRKRERTRGKAEETGREGSIAPTWSLPPHLGYPPPL